MIDWTTAVYSSNVASIGYDKEKSELIVTWKSGRVSVYLGVPEDEAVEISKAPSVGNAVTTEIKPKYPHRYLVGK